MCCSKKLVRRDTRSTSIFWLNESVIIFQEATSHVKSSEEPFRKSLFASLTIFLSLSLLPIALLTLYWLPWLMSLNNDDSSLGNSIHVLKISSKNSRTYLVNVCTNYCHIGVLSVLLLLPAIVHLLDYRMYHGQKQKLFNLSLTQTLNWLLTVLLCLALIFPTIPSLIISVVFSNILRVMLITGSHSMVLTVFVQNFHIIQFIWTIRLL